MRPDVAPDPPVAICGPFNGGVTEYDDEDQGLPPLQPVHEQMSLRLKHTGASPEELKGLRGGSGREGDDAYEFLVFRGISGCRDAAACCVCRELE